ncbi:hypothetical protein ACG33_07890 [Steroidobacter denitrificans]|uniref:VOC domain-containing protein n=1 Tax=Steroidobacter denitrificans TaxID=465721 RepID=A0A127FBP4_STEDE|nr:VOC family protein [Steroidobacter denitrificans]AMN47018.1 hypothetical protein ACG33_07890 [Steroidobacter denitrificans]
MTVDFRLGPYYFQTAYVVRDLAAAEKWFGRILSVPAWTTMEIVLGEGCYYRGKPADSSMKLSLGYAGDVQIELIEPARGASIYEEFIEKKGYGLHHIAFSVPDFEEAVKMLTSRGLTAMSSGVLSDGGVKFAYFDCEDAGASVIEILGFDAATTEFMEKMKVDARESIAARAAARS